MYPGLTLSEPRCLPRYTISSMHHVRSTQFSMLRLTALPRFCQHHLMQYILYFVRTIPVRTPGYSCLDPEMRYASAVSSQSRGRSTDWTLLDVQHPLAELPYHGSVDEWTANLSSCTVGSRIGFLRWRCSPVCNLHTPETPYLRLAWLFHSQSVTIKLLNSGWTTNYSSFGRVSLP